MTPSAATEDRITAFEQALLDWLEQARPGVPTFALPDAPDVQAGRCISCGVAVEAGRWRCVACLLAIERVLHEFGG